MVLILLPKVSNTINTKLVNSNKNNNKIKELLLNKIAATLI